MLTTDRVFSNIPANYTIGFYGSVNFITVQLFIISAARPDITIKYIINNSGINEPEAPLPVITADEYSKILNELDALIICGKDAEDREDTEHQLNAIFANSQTAKEAFIIYQGQTEEEFKQLMNFSDNDYHKYLSSFVDKDLYVPAAVLHESSALVDSKDINIDYQAVLPDYELLTRNLLLYALAHITNAGARYIILSLCTTSDMASPTEYERSIEDSPNHSKSLFDKTADDEFRYKDDIRLLLGDISSTPLEYAHELSSKPFLTVQTSQGLRVNNLQSKYKNATEGIRVTTDIPDSYSNYIHLIGHSRFMSDNCEDRHTIASYLQRVVNSKEKKYKVCNFGVCSRMLDKVLYILNSEPKAGDIYVFGDVIIPGSNICRHIEKIHPTLYRYSSALRTDLSLRLDDFPESACFKTDLQQRKNAGDEIFYDYAHFTHKGNELIAEQLYDFMAKGSDSDQPVTEKQLPVLTSSERVDIENILEYVERKYIEGIQIKNEIGLKDYLASLQRITLAPGSVGAIVMNCNPFTLGHQYLIEYAAGKVDNLIIFVVEADLSFFKLKDRIELISKGTAYIPNVKVIPSGSYIISTITFPEYFRKERPQESLIDATQDLNIFGECIAPALHITRRFVGEEPNCQVTRQYNTQMKAVLPKHHIEVIEIPRKEFSDKPISASLVRKYIKEGRAEKIKEIVPITTYNFLIENYFTNK